MSSQTSPKQLQCQLNLAAVDDVATAATINPARNQRRREKCGRVEKLVNHRVAVLAVETDVFISCPIHELRSLPLPRAVERHVGSHGEAERRAALDRVE